MGLLETETRNDSAKVWTLLPEIEAELEAGSKRPEIYEALKLKHGLTLTYDGFLSALKRARKKAGAKKKPTKATDVPDDKQTETPLKTEPTEPKQEKPKQGIISKNDFKPSADIDDKLAKLTGKNRKY
ncbi:hypothetical protein [Halomonas casei]|uniref:hypothetical protein n=1 Tax=Halomonas casei TaxID=2742613 RepID=UPI003CE827D4